MPFIQTPARHVNGAAMYNYKAIASSKPSLYSRFNDSEANGNVDHSVTT